MKKFLLCTFVFCLITATGTAATLQDFEGGVGTAVGATSANSPCYGNAWAAISTVAGNGGNVLQHDDGGYGNGVVVSFPAAVAADGIYTVSCEIQVNDASNLGMPYSYDVENHEPLCYGFGVSSNGAAVVSPNQVSGMYCAWTPNLTTGDDSGLGFQTVSITVPLKAGDLWMWFSTMPNFSTSGTGAWGTDTVWIDNISLTPVADGAIKTVGPTGDYATCEAAMDDIWGGTVANQHIALWIDSSTPVFETGQVEFRAATAACTLYVTTDPDDAADAVLVGAAVNEAWQVDSQAGSTVKFSDLTFIPPYEADGMVGTGGNSSFDGFETYCVGAGFVDIYFANCVFTGSTAPGVPSDPSVALPVVANASICVYGDDWHFFHSNTPTTLDNCVIGHIGDDGVLTYSDMFIFNKTQFINTAGRAMQDLADGPGDGAATGNQHVEVIGWNTANPVVFDNVSTRKNEHTYTDWGTSPNLEGPLLRFVSITNTGGANPQSDSFGFYTNCDRPATLDYVTIANNGDLGIDFHAPAAASAEVTLTNSSITGNGDTGVQVIRALTCDISNTTITGNAGSGISFDLYAVGAMTVDNCDINTNTGRGIYFDHGASSMVVTNTEIANCDDGIRSRAGAGASISGTIIRDNTGAGIIAAATMTLDSVAIDGNGGAGLSLLSTAGATVSATACTLVGNGVGIANGDGVTDNLAIGTVTNTIIAGPGYAFANNNAADQGESVTVMYSAISYDNHSPDDVDEIFDPAAPNRAADDPFNYGDASVVQIPPQFVSLDPASADYLDVDNSNYGDKADGGFALVGYGDYIGALSIDGWDSY